MSKIATTPNACPALAACYVEGRHDCEANRFTFSCVGSQHWCVAPRLTERLRAKGYKLAIPQKAYAAIMRAFEATPAGSHYRVAA